MKRKQNVVPWTQVTHQYGPQKYKSTYNTQYSSLVSLLNSSLTWHKVHNTLAEAQCEVSLALQDAVPLCIVAIEAECPLLVEETLSELRVAGGDARIRLVNDGFDDDE